MTYIPQATIYYSSITWISAIKHGLTRIIRFQIKESKNSIGITYSIRADGAKVEKETAVDYIVSKINKKT